MVSGYAVYASCRALAFLSVSRPLPPAFSVQTFGLRSGLYWVRLKGFILRYRNKETR